MNLTLAENAWSKGSQDDVGYIFIGIDDVNTISLAVSVPGRNVSLLFTIEKRKLRICIRGGGWVRRKAS